MRRAAWPIAGVVLVATLWALVPSLIVQQRLTSALRQGLPAAEVSVRARATASGVLRGYVNRVDVSAARVRVGELTAERFSASLVGVQLRRNSGGDVEVAGVQSGTARLEVTQENLAEYLGQRGVQEPKVTIDESGVTATGNLQAGPVLAPATIRGQFSVVNKADLYFQIESLELGGVSVAGSLATALLGTAQRPLITLSELPVPVVADRVSHVPGRVLVDARIGGTP
jgi:hypothetical protein